MKLNTPAFVGALAASLVLAGSALANPVAAPSVRVSYADLNLATAAGVAKLHSRLRAASESLCGQADSRDLTGVTQLQLVVASRGLHVKSNYAIWAEPMLVKK